MVKAIGASPAASCPFDLFWEDLKPQLDQADGPDSGKG